MGRACAAILAAVVAMLPTVASAEEGAERRRECARTSEDGQKERTLHHFRAARERFLMCAQEQCPEVVRKDCLTWLEKIEEATRTWFAHLAR